MKKVDHMLFTAVDTVVDKFFRGEYTKVCSILFDKLMYNYVRSPIQDVLRRNIYINIRETIRRNIYYE